MLTAMLVDDEYYALEGLKTDLEELENVKVLGSYDNGHAALENISVLNPDVVFLDIDMPGMNGLELFDKLLEICPQTSIVFVTAYNQYAIKAFELNAVDYILKPVQPERLQKTLARLQKNIAVPEEKQLSIRCFGRLSIQINRIEEDIPWRTKKAEELFAYLLCAKGQFVAKEKLAEILWPELDSEKSKANFYFSYHYLKKQSEQLGIQLPLESARNKIRLNTDCIELDITAFEKGTSDIKEIKDSNLPAAEKIAALYRAPLLDGHYYEWSTELSWQYEILYKELAEKLTSYYQQNPNPEKEYFYRMKAAF